MLDQLREDPRGARGVHKGDEVPVRPATGLFVDQLDSFGGESGQFRRDVVRSVGDVVETLTSSSAAGLYPVSILFLRKAIS